MEKSIMPRWFVPALVTSGLLVALSGLAIMKRDHTLKQ